MNYAGATNAPIQSTSVCTHTDKLWVGAQPVSQKKHPVASVTSMPVPSISRSLGTTSRMVVGNKPVVPTKSSPPKDTNLNKPTSTKVSHVHEYDAYFTVKTYRRKSKKSSLMTNVQTSPI